MQGGSKLKRHQWKGGGQKLQTEMTENESEQKF
jgi:hypothetical protein